MNIAHNVERARRHFPDREAILFEGKTLTYAQLDESVSRVVRVRKRRIMNVQTQSSRS